MHALLNMVSWRQGLKLKQGLFVTTSRCQMDDQRLTPIRCLNLALPWCESEPGRSLTASTWLHWFVFVLLLYIFQKILAWWRLAFEVKLSRPLAISVCAGLTHPFSLSFSSPPYRYIYIYIVLLSFSDFSKINGRVVFSHWGKSQIPHPFLYITAEQPLSGV